MTSICRARPPLPACSRNCGTKSKKGIGKELSLDYIWAGHGLDLGG
jgi:hypothetical protein